MFEGKTRTYVSAPYLQEEDAAENPPPAAAQAVPPPVAAAPAVAPAAAPAVPPAAAAEPAVSPAVEAAAPAVSPAAVVAVPASDSDSSENYTPAPIVKQLPIDVAVKRIAMIRQQMAESEQDRSARHLFAHSS